MINRLSNNLTGAFKKLARQHKLTPENIKQTLDEIRSILLTADVATEVIDTLLDNISKTAYGANVANELKPEQLFKKIFHDELLKLLKQDASSELNLNTKPPAVILLCGLQGSGKTTTCAKIANYLKTKHNQNVLLASTDTARFAAIEQLKILAEQINVNFFQPSETSNPIEIAKKAISFAQKSPIDTVIIDTAGRLHIDADLMQEIKGIHAVLEPIETLFVLDSNTGQDAARSAKEFSKTVPLTGTIVTKTDSDSKGGALLSAKFITKTPIKFIGNSEHITDGLQKLEAKKVVEQLLDMGDIVGLVEKIEKNIDKKKAESLAKRMKTGKFNLNDFAEQIQQMQKLGGMQTLINKMPGAQQYSEQIEKANPDKSLKETLAVIQSMTKKEKNKPDIISGKRKRRIALGCGKDVPSVNKVLKQFKQMQKMIQKAKGGKLKSMMANLGLQKNNPY
jgi:signal recognition particle subunit SRP54